MRTILLTGKDGQIGWELQRTLMPLGRVVAVGKRELELTDRNAVRDMIRESRPDIIVNAAAYTAVDQAERETELALAVNAVAPGVMAEEAVRMGSLLVHYSTDYVFDGAKSEPYVESDQPNPLNAYGRSKLAGEEAIRATEVRHLIFRTSWIYGMRGNNFLRTILRLAGDRDELRVVVDQFGAPTWSRLVAEATAQLLAQWVAPRSEAMYGDIRRTYHLTASGSTSWHGFARTILARGCLLYPDLPIKARRVEAISATEYFAPVRRPGNSRLNCNALQQASGLILPDWDVCLERCLQEMPSPMTGNSQL